MTDAGKDYPKEGAAPPAATVGGLWVLLKGMSFGDAVTVLTGVGSMFAGVFGVGVWSANFIFPNVVVATSATTYYGYYGDLDKNDKTTIRQETLQLSEGSVVITGTSTGVVMDEGNQVQKNWRYQGQRDADALALTFTTIPDKNDSEPSGIGAYQLQKLGSATYTGTAIFWDCELRSFVQCPYVLSQQNIDTDKAKSQWPGVLGRSCGRIDLTPDRGPDVAARSCKKTAD